MDANTTIVISFATVVAVDMGLTQLVKMFVTGSRWAALAAVVIGVILGFFFFPGGIGAAVFTGIVAGLTAAGLYSGTSATFG